MPVIRRGRGISGMAATRHLEQTIAGCCIRGLQDCPDHAYNAGKRVWIPLQEEVVMSTATMPAQPVANWEQVRDEWVAAVEQIAREAETWSEKQGLGVLREPKRIDEERI